MYYNSSSNQAKVCINSQWTAVGVPTVTSLPASPSDGDEVYYQVYVNGQLSGNTSYWHLRYNASTTYWDFLGGPALYNASGSTQFNSTATFSSSGAPYAYLPLNGNYDVTYGDILSQEQVNTFDEMSLCAAYYNGTLSCQSASYTIAAAAYGGSSIHQTFRMPGVTGASGTSRYVQDMYSSPSNISSGFAGMYISVTPVEVK